MVKRKSTYFGPIFSKLLSPPILNFWILTFKLIFREKGRISNVNDEFFRKNGLISDDNGPISSKNGQI